MYRSGSLLATVVLLLTHAACGGNDESTGSGGSSSQGGASSAQGGSSQVGSAQGGAAQGGAAQNGSGAAQSSSGQGGSADPYAAARAACIAKINALRGTKGLAPYAQWTAQESCADQQATSDETNNDPHGSFGQCGESGQNECLGQGPGGIESCLQAMWDEKNQPGCSGCDACSGSYNPNCPNCDFYGTQTGDVCGHYVNMSAQYFSMAACGFSSLGGWDTIDFK